jgi:hypothetical protein
MTVLRGDGASSTPRDDVFERRDNYIPTYDEADGVIMWKTRFSGEDPCRSRYRLSKACERGTSLVIAGQ